MNSFPSFSWRKKAAKISTVDVFPETALQDLLDDPEGSQGFCLLNNVAIGAAYASGYPCGFPENEGWNKDTIPPCHDKRFFPTFVPLHLSLFVLCSTVTDRRTGVRPAQTWCEKR